MRETDLNGFDYKSAKEYVLLYITALKKTDKSILNTTEELKKWENRARLAEANNKFNLIEIADKKIREIKDRLLSLKAERDELKYKVDTLKQNLKRSKLDSQYSVDADKLLAEFQMLIGEENTTLNELKKLETENELDTLKEKLHKKSN